jgi:hypothetical protein
MASVIIRTIIKSERYHCWNNAVVDPSTAIQDAAEFIPGDT